MDFHGLVTPLSCPFSASLPVRAVGSQNFTCRSYKNRLPIVISAIHGGYPCHSIHNDRFRAHAISNDPQPPGAKIFVAAHLRTKYYIPLFYWGGLKGRIWFLLGGWRIHSYLWNVDSIDLSKFLFRKCRTKKTSLTSLDLYVETWHLVVPVVLWAAFCVCVFFPSKLGWSGFLRASTIDHYSSCCWNWY